MRRTLSLLLAVLLLIGAALPVSAGVKEDYKQENGYMTVSPEYAKALIDGPMDIIVIDVRGAEEYEAGHIKGAVNIPLDTLDKSKSKDLQDKNAPILLTCRTGKRSTQAAELLVKKGYTHLYNLQGGITTWPYATEKGKSPKTHAGNGYEVAECGPTTEVNGHTVYACG